MDVKKHKKKFQPEQNDICNIPEITNKFICPVCNHKISFNSSIFRCSNNECGMSFPVMNNIPILINENDSIFNIKDYTNTAENIGTPRKKNAKEIIKQQFRFLPSLSNNLSAKKNFILLEKLLSDKIKPRILIIGGGRITTYTGMIFSPNNIVVESDVYIGPRTQIIIDCHHIPFENETFDLVIFQSVLYCLADPYKCVQEATRVLNSDGLIFASTPFMQQNMGIYDFTRFTHLGHRRLFRAFSEIESGVFAGTGVALGWSIRCFVASLFTNKYLRLTSELLISALFFWLKYIDYLIYNHKATYNGASGFYFIGRKSDIILSDKELIKFYRGP